jgi:hypothetical protein
LLLRFFLLFLCHDVFLLNAGPNTYLYHYKAHFCHV